MHESYIETETQSLTPGAISTLEMDDLCMYLKIDVFDVDLSKNRGWTYAAYIFYFSTPYPDGY